MRKNQNLNRVIIGNSVTLINDGHYAYNGASSTTDTLPSSSPLGEDPENFSFRLDHVGADAAILTLACSANDRFFEAMTMATGPTGVATAISVALNTNFIIGQSRTSIQLIKGDSVQITRQGRLILYAISRNPGRIYSMLDTDTNYNAKYFDNLIVPKPTTRNQTILLPPIEGFVLNYESRPLEFKLGAIGGGGFKATINSGQNLAAAAQNIDGAGSMDLSTSYQTLRLRPLSDGITWGVC